MSSEDQLAKQIERAISKTLQDFESRLTPVEPSAEVTAKSELRDEEDFWRRDIHHEHIADIQSARIQREKYALWVFILVAGWIVALFFILIAQGAWPAWKPFSDKVLIALISSMTVNLIGTLVIVLKYIFKNEQRH